MYVNLTVHDVESIKADREVGMYDGSTWIRITVKTKQQGEMSFVMHDNGKVVWPEMLESERDEMLVNMAREES